MSTPQFDGHQLNLDKALVYQHHQSLIDSVGFAPLSETDLSLNTSFKLPDSRSQPWVQNTFFHFPTAHTPSGSYADLKRAEASATLTTLECLREDSLKTASPSTRSDKASSSCNSVPSFNEAEWPMSLACKAPSWSFKLKSSNLLEFQPKQSEPLNMESSVSDENRSSLLKAFLKDTQWEGDKEQNPRDVFPLNHFESNFQYGVNQLMSPFNEPDQQYLDQFRTWDNLFEHTSELTEKNLDVDKLLSSEMPESPPYKTEVPDFGQAFNDNMHELVHNKNLSRLEPLVSEQTVLDDIKNLTCEDKDITNFSSKECHTTPSNQISASNFVKFRFIIEEPSCTPPPELATMSFVYQKPNLQTSYAHCLNEILNHHGTTEESQPTTPSQNSASDHHPTNCRPCAFRWTKGCINGQDCQFCHERHPNRRKKSITDQRNLMIIARPNGKIEFLRCSLEEALQRT